MSLLKLIWSFFWYPSVWLEMIYWYVDRLDEAEEEQTFIPYEDDLKPSKRTMWDEPKKK